MSSHFGSKRAVQAIVIGGWIVFTVSLAVWWLIHGLMQTKEIALLSPEISRRLLGEQRMLYGEGLTLIFFLIAGGGALFYFSRREHARNRQIQEFFATLTHELKTPLASLRVQVESLEEDLSGSEHSKIVVRLLRDAARLELQLENSLFLASFSDADQLHLERLDVTTVLRKMKEQWPELSVDISGPCEVLADTRALEGVLKNIVQNSRVHGHATQITVAAHHTGDRVKLSLSDNGQGFKGDPQKLGELFTRHTSVSGSGVGLYLARKLTEKMNGSLEFDTVASKGFTAFVTLRGLS